MTTQRGLQRGKQIQALLAQRRQVATDATKGLAPASLRKEPETFCWTLTIRTSRSAWLLSKGTTRWWRKASTACWSPIKRESKLRAALCFARPFFPGGA